MTRALLPILTLAIVTVRIGGTGLSQPALSSPAQKVVDYLLADWSKHMHSTSIALAMKNLGMPPDDDLRMEVGEYFREDPSRARNVRSWGANNYILSNEEKRIVKFLINAFEGSGKMPDLDHSSRELEISPQRLRQRLGFMAKAGLLEASADSSLGYGLTQRYSRWGGPLRFNYHTIQIGDGDPFDVW